MLMFKKKLSSYILKFNININYKCFENWKDKDAENIGTLFSASTRSANGQPPSLMEAEKRHKYLQKQKRPIHSIMYMNKNAKYHK